MSNRTFAIITLLALISPSLPVFAQSLDPTFNPNHIIDDAEMFDTHSLSVSDIQSFLVSKNSYLATYTTLNAYGTLKSAAQLIYDASNNNYDCEGVTLSTFPTELERQQKCQHITTINPKVLLAIIQKESSLIESHDDKVIGNIEKWPLGYDCPDNNGCNPYRKGLGKQINSAALQYLDYMNPNSRYPYKVGQTYVFTNPYNAYCSDAVTTVTPENMATAALYNYTPHVYNGNYNFFTLYKKYFPTGVKNYPDGTLVQVTGEAGVWLLQNGQKRPFTSYSALISRFDPKKIVTVEASAISSYTKGDPIKFPNYSLIQIPSGGIYLLVDNEKRPIASKSIFKTIGFNPAEIITATADELSSYTDGKTITATSTYPTGKLLQDPKSGGVFYIESGYKYPITDKILLSTKFKGKKIVRGTTTELNKYTKGSPVLFGDGELLSSNSSPAIYLISQGRKLPFASGDIFLSLGYKFSNVITVSPQLLALYPTGNPIIIKTPTN